MSGRWAESQVALVTGGASGIGQATVDALAAAGARVVIADRDADRGAEVVRTVESAGEEAAFVTTDVSREPDAKRMVEAALDRFGRLDLACNCAGISATSGKSPSTTVTDLYKEDWDRTVAVNLTGTWLSLKHELGPMLAAGHGAIVNVASINGMVGFPGLASYTAAKAGVIGLTRSAALEVVEHGVRVNVVCPGIVDTPLLEHVFEQHPERRETFSAAGPIGRMADAREVADVIAFLLSPAASFMAGATIPIDGGWTAR